MRRAGGSTAQQLQARAARRVARLQRREEALREEPRRVVRVQDRQQHQQPQQLAHRLRAAHAAQQRRALRVLQRHEARVVREALEQDPVDLENRGYHGEVRAGDVVEEEVYVEFPRESDRSAGPRTRRRGAPPPALW